MQESATRILHTLRLATSRPHKLYPINRLLFQGNRVNRDEGNSPIPVLDRAIALFLSQASGRSTLFGQSQFYHRSPLRLMLETDSAQSFLPMIRRLIPPEVGFYTPSQAGIQVAVTNRQTAMSARLGREVTREEAHSSLGHDGIRVAVTNRQTAMSARDGREVTREEALTDLTSIAGNRSIETAGGFSLRLQRTTMPMDERELWLELHAQLSMIVSCALTDVVVCRLQPLIHYVKLVTRRRTNARERKTRSWELGSAPDVGMKLLVIVG